MPRTKSKPKCHKVSVSLDDETFQLLEAWRMQNYIGRDSRSRAVWGIVSIYLGQSGWKSGPPGIGIAWQHTPGWDLIDPRRINKPKTTTNRLRLV